MNKQINYYLVGIKGIAMSSLALYLKQSGHKVEGSDVNDKFPSDELLNKAGIKIVRGFDPDNIKSYHEVVITTGAHHGLGNIEVITAKKRGKKIYTHAEFLGELTFDKKLIAVAGCHGKTTVSAMISFCMSDLGKDISYLIGTSKIFPYGWGGKAGSSEYFVAEADEYVTSPGIDLKPRFHWLAPYISVILNIDHDHPDVYPDMESIKKSYRKFADNTKKEGFLILNSDNKHSLSLGKKIKLPYYTFGSHAISDFRMLNFRYLSRFSIFEFSYEGKIYSVKLQVPGLHNVYNALSCLSVLIKLGINPEKAISAVGKFTGSKRRLEYKGKAQGAYFYDDYAHHPAEIKATLEALRKWKKGKRVFLLFQPHTYSRTKMLFDEFIEALKSVHVSILTDIYPSAREEKDPSISSKGLVETAGKKYPNFLYLSEIADIIAFLKKNLKKGDIFLTMGAGDIYLWGEKIKQSLNNE